MNETIEKMIKDLYDTWGYDTCELNHIRELMEKLVETVERRHYPDTIDAFAYGHTYGKKSDNE